MSGLGARISANLVWLVLFALGVIAGALLSFASRPSGYQLQVPMPEAGGVLPGQEVTLLGNSVGIVDDVEVVQEGVLVTVTIRDGNEVPADGQVQVLRRSPIGEQAVDFQPLTSPWTPAEPGATIQPASIKIPAKVPFLLQETADLFDAVEVDDVATVVHELGVALDGRGERLKQLNRDSLDLQTTLVEGIPEFERLIDTSEPVLAVLEAQREELADLFTNTADLNEILAENQDQMSALLRTSPPALLEVDALIKNERANLECIVTDLLDLNDMLLGPSTATGAPTRFYETKLDELEMTLRKNQGFFHGFDIVTQHDPTTGVIWNRIEFTADPAGGQSYAQERPTPPTLPGAACVTGQWGTGVNAVRQDNPRPADPTSPGILYAPLVDEQGPEPVSPPDDRPLPATGGGIVLLALPATAAAALWLRRKG